MSDSGQWSDIPGYGGNYKVTPDGRVRSARGELRPFRKDRSEGLYVNLYQHGEMRRVAVSTLVTAAHGCKAGRHD